MAKSFKPGDIVRFVECSTIPEGAVAMICSPSPDYEGLRVWAVDEEFDNGYGIFSNLCLESIMRHVDDDGKELCTSWEDVKSVIGWVPSELVEEA